MKKGFTLVELLAVIVILAIVLAIALPTIMDLIDNVTKNAYIQNEEMMIRATMNYIALNEEELPIEIGTISIITVEKLQDSEFISVINDVSDSSIECEGYVVVKNIADNTFDYMPYLKCGNNHQTEGYGNHIEVEILVVAGGGGGGHRATSSSGSHFSPGGGGAGGVIFSKVDVTIGNFYNVYVGAGGTGGSNNTGQNGEDSLFANLIAIGGGGGGGRRDCNANAGGAGGGGAHGSGSCGDGYGGQGIVGQGNVGSGIVLIRYFGEQRANGGNISTFSGYTIHAFTDIGEHTFELLSN